MGTLGGLGAPKSGGCSAVQGDDYVYVAPPLAAANVEHVPAKSRHLGDPGTSRLGGFQNQGNDSRTHRETRSRLGTVRDFLQFHMACYRGTIFQLNSNAEGLRLRFLLLFVLLPLFNQTRKTNFPLGSERALFKLWQ